MDTFRKFLPIAGVCVLLAAGCGGGEPGLVPIAGTVTLDGQPLSDAEVVFRPASGRPSMGLTDADGRYSLRYSSDAMGAVRGEHRVSISTVRDNTDGDQSNATKPKERVPANYNSQTTLVIQVDPKNKKPVDFELVSKASNAARR